MGGAQNLNAAAALAGELAKEAPANFRVQMLAGQTLADERQSGPGFYLFPGRGQGGLPSTDRNWRWRAWN
jgi:hypothetical protein